MVPNVISLAAKIFSIGAEVCLKTVFGKKGYDFLISLLFFYRFGLIRTSTDAFKLVHWPFGPRAPPPGFDFQQIQILEVTNVKNNGKNMPALLRS